MIQQNFMQTRINISKPHTPTTCVLSLHIWSINHCSQVFINKDGHKGRDSQFCTNTTWKWTAFTITGNSRELSAVNACVVPTLAIWWTLTTCYNAVVRWNRTTNFRLQRYSQTDTIVSKLYDYCTDNKVNNQRLTNYVTNILIWQYPKDRHVIDFADYTVIEFQKRLFLRQLSPFLRNHVYFEHSVAGDTGIKKNGVNQSHYRPEVPRGFQEISHITWQWTRMVVRLSALHTGRFFTPRKYSWYSFLLWAR